MAFKHTGCDLQTDSSLAAAKHLVLPLHNDAATPTLAFGDGDSGLFESSDDVLFFSIAGTGYYRIDATGIIAYTNTSVWGLPYAAASATVPSVVPANGDLNTGMGRATDDALSLIAGGVEAHRMTEAAGVIAHILTGSVQITGALNLKRVAVNAATYSILLNDCLIGVTYTPTGACTVTLTTAACIDGRVIWVVDEGGLAGTNNITVDTEGAELISGAATQVISTNYGRMRIYSNGTNWFLS